MRNNRTYGRIYSQFEFAWRLIELNSSFAQNDRAEELALAESGEIIVIKFGFTINAKSAAIIYLWTRGVTIVALLEAFTWEGPRHSLSTAVFLQCSPGDICLNS